MAVKFGADELRAMDASAVAAIAVRRDEARRPRF
jgi:hypothetical protein